jgi:hypothetical protein
MTISKQILAGYGLPDDGVVELAGKWYSVVDWRSPHIGEMIYVRPYARKADHSGGPVPILKPIEVPPKPTPEQWAKLQAQYPDHDLTLGEKPDRESVPYVGPGVVYIEQGNKSREQSRCAGFRWPVRMMPKVSEPEVRIKTHNEVAEYISRLGWSEYATSREKTLVAGNIWTFWVLMCGGKPEDTKQEELSVFSNPPIDEWRDGNLARSLDSVCDGCANRKPVSLDALAIAVRGYMEQVEKVYPDDVRHLEIMIRNYERLVNG